MLEHNPRMESCEDSECLKENKNISSKRVSNCLVWYTFSKNALDMWTNGIKLKTLPLIHTEKSSKAEATTFQQIDIHVLLDIHIKLLFSYEKTWPFVGTLPLHMAWVAITIRRMDGEVNVLLASRWTMKEEMFVICLQTLRTYRCAE
ncbi:hypothetical protein STEG23_025405 [Scotinomys teguina]